MTTGALAFPVGIAIGPSGDVYHSGELHPDFAGMTLRDWFAGEAMKSLLGGAVQMNLNEHQAREFARFAFMCADAMLELREAGK